MANRILLGNKGGTYGLFVSKPTVNVLTCDDEDLLFDSRKGKFAQVLANQAGTGSSQSVTVPAGKRLMLFVNANSTEQKYDSRNITAATQTVSNNTMSITVANGKKYILLNIEAGNS